MSDSYPYAALGRRFLVAVTVLSWYNMATVFSVRIRLRGKRQVAGETLAYSVCMIQIGGVSSMMRCVSHRVVI